MKAIIGLFVQLHKQLKIPYEENVLNSLHNASMIVQQNNCKTRLLSDTEFVVDQPKPDKESNAKVQMSLLWVHGFRFSLAGCGLIECISERCSFRNNPPPVSQTGKRRTDRETPSLPETNLYLYKKCLGRLISI